MEDDAVSRFRERQRCQKERADRRPIRILAPEQEIQSILDAEIDTKTLHRVETSIKAHYSFEPDLNITDSEVQALLNELRGKVAEKEFDALVESAKAQVLNAITTPFGLAKVLFRQTDKDGGRVSTVHNAETGVFADPEDEKRYRAEYDRTDYEKGFPALRRERFRDPERLMSAYTGRELPRDGRTHVDHVVSAKELHDRKASRLYLSSDVRGRIATSKENLVFVEGSLNQSKGERPLEEWMNDSKSGSTNAERFSVVRDKASEIGRKARESTGEQERKAVYSEVGSRLAVTGLDEGIRMGFQQAIGRLLQELVLGIFDETRSFFRSRREGTITESTWLELKERLACVGKRVAASWKDVVIAFKDGAISAFISNIVTFVVNNSVKTLKNVVRIIREGFCSLLRAFKMLVVPPDGMTRNEAAHEATKLIAAGLAISGGILLEEVVSKLLLSVPLLAPICDIISTVLVGLATGLGTVLLVYLIDKLDFFGANGKRHNEAMMQQLSEMVEEAESATDGLFHDLNGPLLIGE